MAADKDEEDLVGDPSPCYRRNHGNSGDILRAHEGPPAARPEDTGAHGIPTVEDLCELNRSIHADDGEPGRFALDQRAPLLDCLERARGAFESSPEGVVRCAAVLAHGIAQAQAFRDGNRRTAYFATQAFLEEHELGYLSSSNDDMLARKLNQVVEAQTKWFLGRRAKPKAKTFEDLLLRRLEQRTPPTDPPP